MKTERLSIQAQAEECAELIEKAQFIGVLTGAGISTSAGIPDFRGPQGLYLTRKYDPDKVFDINYFQKDPKPFFQFARDFIGLEGKVQPTFAHRFLAQLERKGKVKGIVTQNIDSLHQMAGSKNVLEMHGSFWKSHCVKCQKEFSFEQMKRKLSEEEIPACSCKGVIKPDVVFFGENVKYLSESEELARQSDLFFVIGTSCVVFPAAMIPEYVVGDIVVVNMERVELDSPSVLLNVQEDIDKFFQRVAEHLPHPVS